MPGISPLKKTIFRVLALALGVITSFILLEIGLRILGGLFTPVVFDPMPTTPPTASGPSFEIYCIGDSHTWGVGAARGYSYPDQLGRILRTAKPGENWDVINRGRPGSNTSQALQELSVRLEARPAPSLVLLCSGHNNDHNLAGADFLPNEIRHGNPRAQWAYLFRNSKAFKLSQITSGRIKRLLNSENYTGKDLYDPVIQNGPFLTDWMIKDYTTAKDLCDEAGCKLILIGYANNRPLVTDAMSRMIQNGVPFLDNTNFGSRFFEDKSEFFAPDFHPNEKGYAIIAARVASFLASENLIPVGGEQIRKVLDGG